MDSSDAVENDVGSNLEQTINETLKSKWDITSEVQSKKSMHMPGSIYNFNYDLNDNTSNGIQLNENRNAFATSNCNNTQIHENIDDANGAVGGAISAFDTMQQPLHIDEKSISIKNRLNDSALNMHSIVVANKRQTNIINVPSRPYYSMSDWRERQQKQQQTDSKSSSTFDSVRPMKTQCETAFCKYCIFNSLVNPDSLIMQHAIASFNFVRYACTHWKNHITRSICFSLFSLFSLFSVCSLVLVL